MAKPTTQEHLATHDREIAAIRKLILQGMKMLVSFQKQTDAQFLKLAGEQIETRRELRLLATAQRETDKQLSAFIRSLKGRYQRPCRTRAVALRLTRVD